MPPTSRARAFTRCTTSTGFLAGVRRDDSARTHVYEAVYSESQTHRQIVTELLDRVFDGSAAKLVLQALAAGKASPEELAEIRKLVDKHSGGRR